MVMDPDYNISRNAANEPVMKDRGHPKHQFAVDRVPIVSAETVSSISIVRRRSALNLIPHVLPKAFFLELRKEFIVASSL